MTIRGTTGRFARLLVDEMSGAEEAGFALPTGTVSFLLTDVEGSSRRWEHAPSAMAAAIPRQYELLDEVVASHGGVRPIEQGEGDSVVAAFARASDAVAAALDVQRRLQAEPWPAGAELLVRIAVHTGEAQQRDEGNYFGQTVIRCARLRAIGHGGQTLLSDATAALVVDQLPDGASLVDRGAHRLKDLGRPERVWELVHPDLPRISVPLQSLDAHRHNLPVQLTPLIGRDREIDELAQHVVAERMVTLSGSGGVGKTRLALAVAAEVLEHFPGGVWFVELAGVNDPGGVGGAVLAAMGAHQQGGLAAAEQLVALLPREPTLLVLDNCEHVLESCAALAAALLSRHPAVTVLATSREPVGVPGELTCRVASLSAPAAGTVAAAVPVLSQFDSVRLFLERARRARPSFALTETNAAAVAQICYRLDGIPLALELAAARCRQMSAERIASELDDCFRLLTGGARTVLPRQQTLAASVDWSYDRLDAVEQAVFRHLGVFAGVFPLEAAEAVADAAEEVDPITVFDVIGRLVDKSLVLLVERGDGAQRYRLLETVRAYAVERCRASGELVAARNANVEFWLDWLAQREQLLHTDSLVEQLGMVHDTVVGALEWSTRAAPEGLRLLRMLSRVWQASGRPQDVLGAVDQLLTDENAARLPVEWAAAAAAVAVLVIVARGEHAASALLQRAHALAEQEGNEYFAAVTDMLLSYDDERCERVRRLAHENGQRYVECIAVLARAQVVVEAEPLTAAVVLGTPELQAAARESRYLRDFANRTAARASLYLGDLTGAIELARRLMQSPSLLMATSAVRLLGTAGLLARSEAAIDAAIEVAHDRLIHVQGTADTVDAVLHQRDLLAGSQSRVEDALRPEHLDPRDPPLRFSGALQAREAIDAGDAAVAVAAMGPRSRIPLTRTLQAAIEGGAGGVESHFHEALHLAAEHGLRTIAVDALEGLAVAAAAAEAWAECLRLAAAAARLRDEIGYRWRFRGEQERLDGALAAATEALGPDGACTATDEGAALEWHDAAAYAARARGERKRPNHGWAALTPTELQVVALVASGLTNPQIAEQLLMGRATVKTHLEHTFAKTGLHSRSELAAEYVRRADRSGG